MKTLADLKREGHLFEWSLQHNSWYATVPDFQKAWRPMSKSNTLAFYLKTNKNGLECDSLIYWPKASELTIKQDGLQYVLTIERKIPADPNMDREESIHTMIYFLRPNLNLI